MITAEDRRLFPELRYPPDAYGYHVNGQGQRVRRHRKCRCEVPCQMRFTCRSGRHRGTRSTPWCNGSDGESCDDCWVIGRDALRILSSTPPISVDQDKTR